MANPARKPTPEWPLARIPVSASDYLVSERLSDSKSEYVDGAVYAMGGSSDWHNMVALNLCGLLNAKLPDRCRALGLDVRLWIKTNEIERYYYPDAFVTCGEPLSGAHEYREAIVVAEVLSPTTGRFDRIEKFAAYKQMPMLEEYVLLAQDALHGEVFRRAGGWNRELLSQGSSLRLESLNLELPLTEIYRRVPVGSPLVPPQGRTSSTE